MLDYVLEQEDRKYHYILTIDLRKQQTFFFPFSWVHLPRSDCSLVLAVYNIPRNVHARHKHLLLIALGFGKAILGMRLTTQSWPDMNQLPQLPCMALAEKFQDVIECQPCVHLLVLFTRWRDWCLFTQCHFLSGILQPFHWTFRST